MKFVTIKEVKGVVICADDGTAEHVFNVKNATDKVLKVGLHLSIDDSTNEEWLKIDGATEHELDIETMTQISVKIQVPADGAPDKYSYRLRVFDPDAPGENYTDGDPVYFEVPAKKKKVEPQKENGKQPFKWWIPVAIAAGVIVIGVGVWLAWPSGVKLPDFTRMDLASAEKFLGDHKIIYDKKVKVDPRSKSEIIDQDPDPETKVKEGDKVTLTIARVKVPPLMNLKLFDALQKIDSSGLTLNADKDLHSQKVTNRNLEGRVRKQQPAPNAIVAKDTGMKIWIGVIGKKSIGVFMTPHQQKTVMQHKSIVMPKSIMTRSVEPESE